MNAVGEVSALQNIPEGGTLTIRELGFYLYWFPLVVHGLDVERRQDGSHDDVENGRCVVHPRAISEDVHQ